MHRRILLFFPLTLLALACTPHARAQLTDPSLAHELEAPDRDQWQLPHAIVQALEIQPGQRVVDLGAGTGYMLPFLNEAVGPTGKVYAVEVQKDFISALKLRVHHEQLAQVEVLEDTQTALPLPEKVDRVLLLDTYRELEEPIAMLRAVRQSLKPGGLVVIVDARPDPGVEGPPPDQRLSAHTVEDEARGAGLTVVAESEHLPRQFLLVLAETGDAARMAAGVTPTAP